MKKTAIYASLLALVFAVSSCTKGCDKAEPQAQEQEQAKEEEAAKEEAPAEPEKHDEAGHEHDKDEKVEE